jgi:hypothetical protein
VATILATFSKIWAMRTYVTLKSRLKQEPRKSFCSTNRPQFLEQKARAELQLWVSSEADLLKKGSRSAAALGVAKFIINIIQ